MIQDIPTKSLGDSASQFAAARPGFSCDGDKWSNVDFKFPLLNVRLALAELDVFKDLLFGFVFDRWNVERDGVCLAGEYELRCQRSDYDYSPATLVPRPFHPTRLAANPFRF